MDNEGPTVQHRELCLMLCGSLDGRGVWGHFTHHKKHICLNLGTKYKVRSQLPTLSARRGTACSWATAGWGWSTPWQALILQKVLC